MRAWTSSPIEPRRNVLLATLDPMELENLADDLEAVSIDYREVLYHPGEPLSHVYFPVTGMISIVAVSAAGASVEVGPVGSDGMVGLPVYLVQ